jgi:hypothetical protein
LGAAHSVPTAAVAIKITAICGSPTKTPLGSGRRTGFSGLGTDRQSRRAEMIYEARHLIGESAQIVGVLVELL